MLNKDKENSVKTANECNQCRLNMKKLLFVLLVFLFNCETSIPVVQVPRLSNLNAGHATSLKIPIEENYERIRSHPHIKAALIRSLGATALKQRAGRNLIFRVLLTIGYQNNLIDCTASVMCEVSCLEELNKKANNYLDTYPTDPFFVTYVLDSVERGRELGGRYECDTCAHYYPLCKDAKLRAHVYQKYNYLMEVTNFVLSKLPA